ncbi:mediator of DNA damage checkpoint protein 1 [Drosophila teissieri]|uniref:mediator of DNA damage checkpoint protein 1 n=1 Tax=Drosophila teissieri TaxID=7243 RepID=UPI001CBA462E|nr:mediator of DNA damage checkpoint protein 1 [Drosophila teissieri]
MSSKNNGTPPGDSAAKGAVPKIPEEPSISTDHPVATSTPTYMARNRQRLLSLQMDSEAFTSGNSSLVYRVPPTYGHIRGRKGIHDPSTPITPKLPRTRARNLPNTPVRVTPSRNTPFNTPRNSGKPKTPAQKKTTKKTPAKTPKITPKTKLQNPLKSSPIVKPKTPTVESPIASTELPILLPTESQMTSPSKSPKMLSIEAPVMLLMNSPKQSVKSALKRAWTREENSPRTHFSEEVSNKKNADAEDISEPPPKQARLHILQVNLGSPFSMTRSKKIKSIAVELNDEVS